MSLDSTFGPLIRPQGVVYEWERAFVPASLSKLNGDSARILKHTMEEIVSGWRIGRVLTYDTIILWLIDEIGDVWFALEELVVNAAPTGHPKHQRLPATMTLPKLGHPALIDGARARIGGELYFDSGFDPALWIINNRSGRYGRHSSRASAHLDNVAKRFGIYGIQVSPHFLPG